MRIWLEEHLRRAAVVQGPEIACSSDREEDRRLIPARMAPILLLVFALIDHECLADGIKGGGVLQSVAGTDDAADFHS